MVRVELPPAVTGVGLNDEIVPLGAFTDSATLWAEPEVTAVEIVLVPLLPCTRFRLVGEAEIEKSLGCGVVTVMDNEGVLAGGFTPLEAWTTKVKVPVTDGVPDSTPVVAVRVSPVGRDPLVTV
jgi:hypothetical protein